jgi:hypothetical protein
MAAADVMRRGPQTDVEPIGMQAGAGAALPGPLLAIHGASDSVVAPVNTVARGSIFASTGIRPRALSATCRRICPKPTASAPDASALVAEFVRDALPEYPSLAHAA